MNWETVEGLLDLADQALEVVSHPAAQMVLIALAAPIAALLVGGQARRMGLDQLHIPGFTRFRFPTLFATLTFWGTLFLGANLVFDAGWAIGYLLEACIKGFLAAATVAVGMVAHQAVAELASESRTPKTRELLESLRPATVVAGLGMGAVVLADAGAFILVIALAAAAALFLVDEERRAMVWTLADNGLTRLGSLANQVVSPQTPAQAEVAELSEEPGAE